MVSAAHLTLKRPTLCLHILYYLQEKTWESDRLKELVGFIFLGCACLLAGRCAPGARCLLTAKAATRFLRLSGEGSCTAEFSGGAVFSGPGTFIRGKPTSLRGCAYLFDDET